MNTRTILWWALFFPLSLVLQWLLPGLDALVIGLVLTLQARHYKNLLWLLPVLVIVQEGIGSRDFGAMLLWYAAVIGLFMLGRWLFEVQNFLFIFLLSAFLGSAHFALAHVLAPLQNMTVDIQTTLDESVVQAMFIPIAWRLAWLSRQWVSAHDEAS